MKKMNKKQKAVVLTLFLLVASVGCFSSITLAHPPQPQGDIRAFKGDVNVSLVAIDNDSGINYTIIEVWYRPNIQSSWDNILPATNYTGTITFSAQGWYQVHFYSVDNCSNVESEKYVDFVLWQDAIAPFTYTVLEGTEIITH